MSLFQNSVIKRYLKNQDGKTLVEAYEKFKAYFHDPEIQDNIRHSKEEQFQEGFLRELFVKILGYTLNPSPDYNLTTELKNEKDAKKADGAILKDGKALAVIELKGTDTKDLSKISDQAFGYKNNHSDCVYVVTSNFEKVRFYIHNAVDYLEFNLFNLLFEDFECLWFCLQADNLIQGLPLKAKEESVLVEEQITKQLYKDYSSFKQELWQNVVELNPEHDPLLLFKKTQKLLDRFLFVFFAEDSGLLPPNSIPRMVERYKILRDEDAYKPLYEIYKQFFGYINIGRKGKMPQDDIYAYNGGLFVEDAILDSLKIEDELLERHTMKMTAYDFESDVDVNILGHIFENSLNEIENITARLEGKEIDKNKTKRKKDGVFYTPKYITKYIVDHTVGKLCEEKKAELDLVDEEYAKGRRNRKKETIKKLDQKLQDYRNWLLEMTICDPACGSGAFLNQALDFLIKEHSYIDELESQLLGYSFEFPGVENHILERNLYGVDINDESVEIAKLSLWLRTAQRGRKLTSLNHNIKCGNSLIDDPEVAGDKAFHWPTEFPHIFQRKNKKAWHITTATHNSRYSERMKELHIKTGDPIWLSEKEELIVTETISKVVEEDQLNVMAYNICGDHLHMILVCEEEEIPEIVGKLKSMSARAANIAMGKTKPAPTSVHAPKSGADTVNDPLGHAPAKRERGETQNKLWTSKYGCAAISSDEQLQNTIHYIETNRQKHELPDISKKLKPYLKQMLSSETEAFKPEYKGGFDVVIGNPPYVRQELVKGYSISLKKYEVYEGKADLYTYFYEKALKLLKPKGFLSYISSGKFFEASYGKTLVQYLVKKSKIVEIINFDDLEVFEGISAYPLILVTRNIRSSNNYTFNYCYLPEVKFESLNSIVTDIPFRSIYMDDFINSDFKFYERKIISLLEKLKEGSISLKDLDFVPVVGVKTGYNDGFTTEFKNSNYTKPYVFGKNLKRYMPSKSETEIIFPYEMHKDEYNLVNIEKLGDLTDLLLKNREKLEKRAIIKDGLESGNKIWYEYQQINRRIDFEKEYIVYPNVSLGNNFTLSSGFVVDMTAFIIPSNDKFLLAILNSSLINFLMKNFAITRRGGYQEYKVQYLIKLPIKVVKESVKLPFQLKVDQITEQLKTFQKEQNYLLRVFKTNFTSFNLNTRLKDWHQLEFQDFLKELKKQKIKLSLSEQSEWLQYFEEQKQKVQEIQTQIDQTDREIDQMVYELYGLTEEEIKIVEEAVK